MFLLKRIKHQIYKKFFLRQDKNNEFFPSGHFYSPIPNLEEIKAREKEIFSLDKSLEAININKEKQLSLLNEFMKFYRDIPFPEKKQNGFRYFFENDSYSYSDAIFLYSIMRYLKPKRVIEVGSGYSSACMLDVNDLFLDNSVAFDFIEPYPELLNSLLKEDDKKNVVLKSKKLQEVDLDFFKKLEENDILFIDSTHVSKVGSDVNYIIHEILPILKKGVYIHFHDIFYPFEYPSSWVFGGRSWNEVYMLRAFLEFNDYFQIVAFNTYLEYKYRDFFEKNMPLCLKNAGGSIWLKRIN